MWMITSVPVACWEWRSQGDVLFLCVWHDRQAVAGLVSMSERWRCGNKLPINQSISVTLYRASPAPGKEKSKYITVQLPTPPHTLTATPAHQSHLTNTHRAWNQNRNSHFQFHRVNEYHLFHKASTHSVVVKPKQRSYTQLHHKEHDISSELKSNFVNFLLGLDNTDFNDWTELSAEKRTPIRKSGALVWISTYHHITIEPLMYGGYWVTKDSFNMKRKYPQLEIEKYFKSINNWQLPLIYFS